ncbi:iron-binding protein [Serratia sp. S1B]|nr:iron-binding protein [Serratia sp. S1B]
MNKIKIAKNGPYLITGKIKLIGVVNAPDKDGIMQQNTVKTFETQDNYSLCRCGHSKNKPFCDGTHNSTHFDGTETASKAPYLDRVQVEQGDGFELLDDDRCAFGRFCHRKQGIEVWTLTEHSSNPSNKAEAIMGASACPSGRLTALVDNQLVEDEYQAVICVVEDPEKGVSAGLYVRGDIALDSAETGDYEQRNRLALCRCGASGNKPFCDGSHVSIGFKDKS